ncbi:hypothetical protein [Numidum massiliense]|uniref:hypothetical protein n=1 Tax=Numidum massiliense TaxID=1522315 RepID=UPI0006D54F24|nr:hypothetical protein [Numidum massiliense]
MGASVVLPNIVGGLIIGGAIFYCIYLSGGKDAKGDERQKEIRRRATLSSWIVIIAYCLQRGILAIPWFGEAQRGSLVSIPALVPEQVGDFLRHGFDVVIVGLIAYAIFFVVARRRLT